MKGRTINYSEILRIVGHLLLSGFILVIFWLTGNYVSFDFMARWGFYCGHNGNLGSLIS